VGYLEEGVKYIDFIENVYFKAMLLHTNEKQATFPWELWSDRKKYTKLGIQYA
jgi:hypothetical protein